MSKPVIVSAEPTWESPADRFRLKETMAYKDPLVPAPTYKDIAASNTLVLNTPLEDLSQKKRFPWLEVLGALIGFTGMLAMIGYVAFAAGASNMVIALISAMFPMGIVVGTMVWIDRWEPEPRWVLLLSFLWGAGVATSISLIANQQAFSWLEQIVFTGDSTDSAGSTFGAPLVEETLKGLGVVLLMFLNRRHINSPLDGVVIASILAGGFAFTENVLYFAKFSDTIISTFIMRALLAPFTHSVFTSMTGLALALAMTRSRSRFAWIWMVPVGWVTAVGLHGLWNGLASYSSSTFIIIYLLFWLPLFITWLTVITAVSVKQRRWVMTGLQAFVKTGWIHPLEASMLSSLMKRRIARRQARKYGKAARDAMAEFQQVATEMSLTYVMLMYTGHTGKQRDHLKKLVTDVVASRRAYEQQCQIANAKQVVAS